MEKGKWIPLRNGEATEIQLLWACREILDTTSEWLKKRLKACNRWAQFRTMQTWFGNITEDIMLTIDPQKAKTFLLNLSNQQIRVVSKSRATTEPGYSQVPTDVLSNVILQAMTDTCMLCDGEGCDMAKCKFRKPLKAIILFDVDESNGVCMGKTLLEKLEQESHNE